MACRKRISQFTVVSLAILCLANNPAYADTYSWQSSALSGTSSWNTSGNWLNINTNTNAIPANSSASTTLLFPQGFFATSNNNIANNFGINKIQFTSTTTSYTLRGNRINLGSGGINNSSSALQTLSFTSGAGVTLVSPQTWTTGPSSSLAVTNITSSGNALTLEGSGTVIFSGSSSFSNGDLIINGGTLRVTAANSINNSKPLINSGGTLEIASSVTLNEVITFNGGTLSVPTGVTATKSNGITFSSSNSTITVAGTGILDLTGTVTGTGGFTKLGSGTLTLTRANDYSGDTSIQAGTLSLENVGALGTSTVLIDSSGTLALSRNGTYSKSFTLNGGTLNVPTSFTVTESGTISLANSSTIQADGSLNLTGTLSGSSGLTSSGTNTLQLSGTNTGFTGPLTISAGTLQTKTTLSGSNDTTVNGTLKLGINTSLGSLAGSGTVNLQTFTLTTGGSNASSTYSGVISGTGALVKQGIGTLTLSNSNTYSGGTSIQNGTLNVTNSGALGTGSVTVNNSGILGVSVSSLSKNLTLNGGTLNVPNAQTAEESGIISLTSNSFIKADGNLTLSNAVTGSGGLTSSGAGTLTLSGTNSFTGPLTVSAGTLTVNSALSGSNAATATGLGTLNLGLNTTLGSLAGSGIANLNSFMLTSGGDNSSTTFSGTLSGTGGLTKQGTGIFTLSGTNSFTGPLTIDSGTLVVNSALSGSNATKICSNGTLSLGTDTVLGSLTGSGIIDLNDFILTAGGSHSLETFSGSIAGSGGLNKQGTDTVILSSANTFLGDTHVGCGTLIIGNDNALGGNPAVQNTATVASGATLKLESGVLTPCYNCLCLNGSGVNGLDALHLSGPTAAASWGGMINLKDHSTIGSAGCLTLNAIDKTGKVLTLKGGGTITINGPISGNTSLFNSDLIVDGVTVNLNTANSYLGPTYIRNGGTLNANVVGALPSSPVITAIIMDDTGTGSSTLNLGADHTIAYLQGSSTTSTANFNANKLTIGFDVPSALYVDNANFLGSLTGSNLSSLVKTGSSTQILSGTNPSFTGTTNLLNGNLAIGSTNALMGSGVVISGGTFSTANGPRTINIGGNFSQTEGQTSLIVGGDAASANDKIVLTSGSSTLSLSGGSLNLQKQNNFFLTFDDHIELFTTANPVGVQGGVPEGTPLNLTVNNVLEFSDNPLLLPQITLYQNRVVLEGNYSTNMLRLIPILNMNPNEAAVTTGIQSIVRENGLLPFTTSFAFLSGVPLTQMAALLDYISPDELTSVFYQGVALSKVINNTLSYRMEELRDPACIQQAVGYSYCDDAVLCEDEETLEGCEGAQRDYFDWNVYCVGLKNYAKIDSTPAAFGYKWNTDGFLLGTDSLITDSLGLGFDFSCTHNVTKSEKGGDIGTDSLQLGLYGTYFYDCFFLEGAIHGGLNYYDTYRALPFNQFTTGNTSGTNFDAMIGGGVTWRYNNLVFGPIMRLDYASILLNSFKESGPFAPLYFYQHGYDSWRGSIGVRGYNDYIFDCITLRNEFSLFLQHELKNPNTFVKARFADFMSDPFNVYSPLIGRNSLLAGIGLTAYWDSPLSLTVRYDGEFLRKNYRAHTISAQLSCQF